VIDGATIAYTYISVNTGTGGGCMQ